MYESDRAMFIAAASEAAGAAVILGTPVARRIALLIGMLMANPGGMAKAASEWRSEGQGQDPRTLENLVQHLKDQRDLIVKQEGWSGSAFDTFNETLDDFVESLNKLKTFREGAAGSLEQTAKFFHWVAVCLFWLAQIMSVLVTWHLIGIVWVNARVAIKAAIDVALFTIWEGLKGIVTNNKKVLLVVGAVLGLVNAYSATQAKLIPVLQAIPTDAPHLEQAQLQYDSNAGVRAKISMAGIDL